MRQCFALMYGIPGAGGQLGLDELTRRERIKYLELLKEQKDRENAAMKRK